MQTLTLKFGEITRMADVRRLYDMKEVIYDRKWLATQPDFELYYMYRDLYKNEGDYNVIKQNNLRYDITLMPPKMLGNEFVKTMGHEHPIINNSQFSYTEIYQVLEGKATYLLQKTNPSKESVEDFIVIRAEKGECIIIPPNYGHATVNESKKTLKMANWVCRHFSSKYDLIKKKKGMAYFLTTNGFIQNPEYKNVSGIRELKPVNFSNYGLKKGGDIYGLIKKIDKLKFLTSPSDFLTIFSKTVIN